MSPRRKAATKEPEADSPPADPQDQYWQTLATFAGAMVRTKDLDPVYPVLRALNDADGHRPQSGEALRRTMIYVALYNLSASECVWLAADKGRSEDVARALAGRAGTERRGLRTPDFLIKHLDYIAAQQFSHGGLSKGLATWLQWGWQPSDTPAKRWERTTDMLMNVPYNGRWAAYKTCDLLVEVHGWEMEAPDAGHRWSTGPREGLETIWMDLGAPIKQEAGGELEVGGLPAHTDQRNEAIAALDRATERVQRELWARGAPLKVSEVETILCNWKALRRGRYYIGHDIDEMLGGVLSLPATGEYAPVRKKLLAARRECFAPELLGEMSGWIGIRKGLMPLFAQTGELVNVEVGR